ARGDLVHQQLRRFEPWAVCLRQVPGDVHTHVETDQVGQPQRTHRVFVSQFHRLVDVLDGGDPLLEHPDTLETDGHTESTRGESRNVAYQDRLLADLRAGTLCPVENLAVGRGAVDDLEQVHRPDRVEEMHPEEGFRAPQPVGEFIDADPAGVRRQHHGVTGLCRFEHLPLESGTFRNGLDHRVEAGRQVLDRVAGLYTARQRLGRSGIELALLLRTVGLGLNGPSGSIELCGVRIDELHRTPRGGEDISHPCPHRAGTDHGDAPRVSHVYLLRSTRSLGRVPTQ